MRDEPPIGCLIVMFFAAGCMVGGSIVGVVWKDSYTKAAINRGEAAYDSKTGELIWNPDPPTAAPRQE